MSEYKRTQTHKQSTSSGIYCITNLINNKKYIGQTYDIKYRWKTHNNDLNSNKHHNKHLQSAWIKYGKENFKFEVIEYCPIELLDEREIYWISYFDSIKQGYNISEGGLGCRGYKHTKEEIKKMRQIQNPKAVLQFDADFNLVGEWDSCSHAGKTLGYYIKGIKSCCDRINRQKTIGGFYWIYKEEYENGIADLDYYINNNKSKPKRVSQYDLNMNLIKIYDSVYQSSKELNIGQGEISAVCNYKRKTSHNFIFRFTDSYTDEQYNIDKNTIYNYDKNKSKKRINQYDMDGNLIKTYDSLSQIEKEKHYTRSVVRSCCNQKNKNAYGFVWRFAT